MQDASAFEGEGLNLDQSLVDFATDSPSMHFFGCPIPLFSDVLYQHRDPLKRYNVIDLDPYGTASPFIDGAVQAVSDGGMNAQHVRSPTHPLSVHMN